MSEDDIVGAFPDPKSLPQRVCAEARQYWQGSETEKIVQENVDFEEPNATSASLDL
jgi:hypothetical protein